jgi:hypothetical protein
MKRVRPEGKDLESSGISKVSRKDELWSVRNGESLKGFCDEYGAQNDWKDVWGGSLLFA